MGVSQAARAQKETNLTRVYQLINRAAVNGEKCPTNRDLADAIGIQSVGRVADYVSFLATSGMIEVHRSNSSRVVIITASGKRTAGTVGNPHWTMKPAIGSPELTGRAKLAAANEGGDLLQEITAEAERIGKPMSEFLTSLLWMGFQCHVDDLLETEGCA